MATATKTTDAARDRIFQVNEQILETGRKAGLSLVDSYEKGWKSVADLQEKVGDETNIEWVSALTHAQARFTRELTDAYASTAKSVFRS
jgi:hypothetical protein